MRAPKVSVVVSAYNLEAYIGECLDSILNQSFLDFECIVVNDGSTDKTEQIIKKYPKKDKRFKVINKENGGVSTARNTGFDTMQGEYVIFLDGDDFYTSNLLETLHKRIEGTKSDIVVCNYKSYFESMQKYSEPRIDFSLLKGKKYVSHETDPDNLFNVLTLMFWNKMFRADFLRTNNIRNDESLHRAQDIDFVGRALIATKRIAFIDESLMFYRTDMNSSNVKRIYKYPYDVLKALENVKKYLDDQSLYSKLHTTFIKIAADHILASLYFTETYNEHKKIYHRAKKFLASLRETDNPVNFTSEKSYKETQILLNLDYEGWLRSRIADLRDDRESKYISYLLEQFRQKYDEEKDLRTNMEKSVSWRVTKPLRILRKIQRWKK